MPGDYQDAGVALRGLFLIDPKGVLRQSTINDLVSACLLGARLMSEHYADTLCAPPEACRPLSRRDDPLDQGFPICEEHQVYYVHWDQRD